jgi:hypothetical protein
MRRIHFAVLVCAALAAPALAGTNIAVPKGTVPACISLVGSNGGVAAAGAGQFTVFVHDLANNPIAGASVAIELTSAVDLHFCADQLDPDAIVVCSFGSVRKVSGADGTVRFTLLGGSNGAGNAHTLLGGGRVYANGALIGSPTVSAYDLDGSAGVGANDLSAWLQDFGSGQPYGRSDYDCSGNLGANDLSLWLLAFGSGTMTTSCAASCP